MRSVQTLFIALASAVLLASAVGCSATGGVYAEPAGYYDGPVYYGPDYYYAHPVYRWDHDHHHYTRRLVEPHVTVRGHI